MGSVQARGKRLDAELDKLNVFTQGAVLTGAFFTGLYNEALDVVDAAIMIAETGIETINEIEKAKQKALSIIIRGDISAAKQELEELVAYGEETYDTLQLLYTDNEIKALLMEFPEKYLEAMPAVEKAEAASGLALSLLFALVTGGAGAAASAAAKAPLFIKAANKIKEIIALIKKVKLHRKQRKGHNTKIAEREDKPKRDKLKEKAKKECKDNCQDDSTNLDNTPLPTGQSPGVKFANRPLDGSTIGRTENCVNCVVAGDIALEGRRATALPSNGPVPNGLAELQKHFAQQNGGDTFKYRRLDQINNDLINAGDGARGIIYVQWRSGGAYVFNAINDRGVIKYLDPQTGGLQSKNAAIKPAGTAFMRTNK